MVLPVLPQTERENFPFNSVMDKLEPKVLMCLRNPQNLHSTISQGQPKIKAVSTSAKSVHSKKLHRFVKLLISLSFELQQYHIFYFSACYFLENGIICSTKYDLNKFRDYCVCCTFRLLQCSDICVTSSAAHLNGSNVSK